MIKTVNLSYYDTSTKEFLQTRATVVDDSDPSVDYIPYNATTVLAPAKSSWAPHTHPVFNGTGWTMVADYRGVTFYDKVTQETKEYGLGESPDWNTYINVAPPSSKMVWDNTNGRWIHTLEGHKISKRFELAQAYKVALATPFDTGLTGSYISGSLPVPIIASCSPAETIENTGSNASAYLYRTYTYHAAHVAEYNQRVIYNTVDNKTLLVTGKTLRAVTSKIADETTRLGQKLLSLSEQVERATTIADVDAIVW